MSGKVKSSYTLAKPLIGGYVSSLTLHFIVDGEGRMKVVGFEAKNYPRGYVRWARWRMLKTVKPIVRRYGLDFIRKSYGELLSESKLDNYIVGSVKRELENLVGDLFNWLKPYYVASVAEYVELKDGRTARVSCHREIIGRLDGRCHLENVWFEALDLPTDRLEESCVKALKKVNVKIELEGEVKSGREALKKCLRMDKAAFKKLEKIMWKG